MRAVITLIPVAAVALAGGCSWLDRLAQRDDRHQQQVGDMAPTTAPELVAYLNRQAAAVTALRYPNVSISVTSPQLDGSLGDSWLVAAKPRYFYLNGGKGIAPDLVKIGSNETEFWMQTKGGMGADAQLIYCAHADLPKAAHKLPVPFDPDWAMAALGMVEYDTTAANYRVDDNRQTRTHTLTTGGTSPDGRPVIREIVFSGGENIGNLPRVRQHVIRDAATREVIARADIKRVTQVRGGVEVPTQVTLAWPQQKFKMDLDLGQPKVNEPITEAEVRNWFTRPNPRDLTPINLATAPLMRPSSFRGATPGAERTRVIFGNRR
jgi:hypothetical protein